jgi:hypothetical protein
MSEREHTLRRQVFAAVDNLAAHPAAEKWLAGLGATAIGPLSAYLEQPPAPIPQARCFAVAMLARLPGEAATHALRKALHAYPLASLAPAAAQAEFVVKNDAIAALAKRRYPELEHDLGFALDHERLPAAAHAVAELRLTILSATLATLFDDDTLAAPAAQALLELGAPGTQSLLAALQARLEAPHENVNNRRALLRLLLALGHAPQLPDMAWLAAALRYPSPQVRAAAARIAWNICPRPGLRRALLHGVLSNDDELAAACRTALDDCDWPEYAAVSCLRHGREKNLYGDPVSIAPEAYAWLLRHSLRAAAQSLRVVRQLPSDSGSALHQALACGAIRDFETLECLYRHGDPPLRIRVVAALPYCGDIRALRLAISAYNKHAPGLRQAVRRTLRHWPYSIRALRETLRALPRQWTLLRPILEILLIGMWRRRMPD